MRPSFFASPRRASLAIALCASFVVLVPAASAHAQGRKPAARSDGKNAEAKKLFDEGAASYTQGNYEAAIEAWTKAYDMSKKPLIFESIANAYERLGEAKKAREYLSKWRDVAPKDEQELLDARLKNLDARVARDEELEAARLAEAAKAKKEGDERARQRKSGGAGGTSLPGVVLLGVGGAAVAVGITLDIVAGIRRPAVDAACAPSGTTQICKASSRDAIVSSSTLAIAGDVLWIAGAVAVAGGAALILTHKPPKEGAPPTATWIAPAGPGFVMGHSF